MKAQPVSRGRAWLAVAVGATVGVHPMFPMALHAGFPAGILLGIAGAAIAAHAGLLAMLRRPPALRATNPARCGLR